MFLLSFINTCLDDYFSLWRHSAINISQKEKTLLVCMASADKSSTTDAILLNVTSFMPTTIIHWLSLVCWILYRYDIHRSVNQAYWLVIDAVMIQRKYSVNFDDILQVR